MKGEWMLAASWWFVNLAPHIGVTDHNNWIWGFVHGVLIVPNFIYSLFNENATIYQANNTGAGYNLGFLVGAWIGVRLISYLLDEVL